MIRGASRQVMKNRIVRRTDATPQRYVRRRTLFRISKLLRMREQRIRVNHSCGLGRTSTVTTQTPHSSTLVPISRSCSSVVARFTASRG